MANHGAHPLGHNMSVMGSQLEIDMDPDGDLTVVPRHQGQTGTGCYKLHDHRIYDSGPATTFRFASSSHPGGGASGLRRFSGLVTAADPVNVDAQQVATPSSSSVGYRPPGLSEAQHVNSSRPQALKSHPFHSPSHKSMVSDADFFF